MLRCAEQTWCELWAAKEFQMMASRCIHRLLSTRFPRQRKHFALLRFFQKLWFVEPCLSYLSLEVKSLQTQSISFLVLFIIQLIATLPNLFLCTLTYIRNKSNCSQSKHLCVFMSTELFKGFLQRLSISSSFGWCQPRACFSDDKKQEKTVTLCHIRDKNDKDDNNTNAMTS